MLPPGERFASVPFKIKMQINAVIKSSQEVYIKKSLDIIELDNTFPFQSLLMSRQ